MSLQQRSCPFGRSHTVPSLGGAVRPRTGRAVTGLGCNDGPSKMSYKGLILTRPAVNLTSIPPLYDRLFSPLPAVGHFQKLLASCVSPHICFQLVVQVTSQAALYI